MVSPAISSHAARRADKKLALQMRRLFSHFVDTFLSAFQVKVSDFFLDSAA